MKKTIKRWQGELPDDAFLQQLHPVLQRIYAAREVRCKEDLDRDLQHLLPFHDLLNIDSAADSLAKAVKAQKHIMIVGDYDADGATSTTLVLKALRAMGAKKVSYIVPNRFEYGYGLTPEIVEFAALQHPDLLITVDNGIASCEGVQLANEKNIDVIITDHHLAGETLPDALAIVNPNQPGDTFASKNLAGVGVAFYVMLALRSQLEKLNWFAEKNLEKPNMAQFLDLVALGTFADVVPLDKNNRILVYQGLRRIRAGQCCLGISALLRVAKKNQCTVRASDLGFAVGPRLNAAGRLDDMSLGIECLLTNDAFLANSMAVELDQLNQERRKLESDMQIQALKYLEALRLEEKKTLPVGFCLYHESWHQGVVGILASRIKERFYRPVIAFAKVDNNTLKGSARSITGLHIRDVLAQINSQHPQLVQKFGGHAMAAGLSLSIDKFKQFSKVFDEVVQAQLTSEKLHNILISDGCLQQNELSLTFAETLHQAGPWGQHFPEPIFDGRFSVLDQRLVGENHLKMVLGLEDEDCQVNAIAFNVDLDQWPNHRCDSINAAYRLDINEFRGARTVQLIVEHLEIAS